MSNKYDIDLGLGIRLLSALTSQIMFPLLFPSSDIFFYFCRQFGVLLYLVVNQFIKFLQAIFFVKNFALISMFRICENYLNTLRSLLSVLFYLTSWSEIFLKVSIKQPNNLTALTNIIYQRYSSLKNCGPS